MERENRTIVDMAWILKYSIKEIDFLNSFLVEFFSTSIYILNRTGTSSVPSLSPYELWIGKKPRIKHIHIIRSICYVHVQVHKRRKIDKKATKDYLYLDMMKTRDTASMLNKQRQLIAPQVLFFKKNPPWQEML